MSSPLTHLLWKSLRREDRAWFLQRLNVIDRQGFNMAISQRIRLPDGFRKNNCIFIHVPKCAGNSIVASLFNEKGPGHLPLTWYEDLFPDFYQQAFKFAFVRDPLERTYSAWRYLSTDRGIERDRKAMEMVRRHPDFDGFVKHWLCPENAQRQIHFTPQWMFICNNLGELAVDFIGRYEQLDTDFATLCNHLGRRDAVLQQANISTVPASPLDDLCSKEAQEIIYHVYARDYQLLGYEKTHRESSLMGTPAPRTTLYSKEPAT